MIKLASQRAKGSPQHWDGRCLLSHSLFIWVLGFETRFSCSQSSMLLTELHSYPYQVGHSGLEFLRQWGSGDSGTEAL